VIKVKKRLVMKGWVEKVLGVIAIALVMIIASECDNEMIFILSHIGAGIMLVLISIIFTKYGRDCD
jgi:hypothetical protein